MGNWPADRPNGLEFFVQDHKMRPVNNGYHDPERNLPDRGHSRICHRITFVGLQDECYHGNNITREYSPPVRGSWGIPQITGPGDDDHAGTDPTGLRRITTDAANLQKKMP
jgi:hypothetical protein